MHNGVVGSVRALTVHDAGQGPLLYIGGSFTSPAGNNLVAFDGTQWIACDPSLNGPVEALLSVPKTAFKPVAANDQLYVAGNFTGVQTGGNNKPRRIARWDGTWSSFQGGGMNPGPNAAVHALQLFESQGVSHVYFGGSFTQVDGVPLAGLGRFVPEIAAHITGAISFDAEVTGQVFALEVFDGGDGARLYAGGSLLEAGGQPVTGLAAFTGQSWESVPALGGSGSSIVEDLHVHDDGAGKALYATGQFSLASGVPVTNLARFDGQSWTPLQNGLVGSGLALATHPHPRTIGPALFVGFTLPAQPDSGDSHLAVWGRDVAPSGAFTAIAGCTQKQVVLTPSSGLLSPGNAEALQLSSPVASGLALLYLGAPSGLPGGCGLVLPGIGELMLALAPAPFALSSATTSAGVTSFAFGLPANSALIGKTLLLQAVQLDFGQVGLALELSTAVAALLQP